MKFKLITIVSSLLLLSCAGNQYEKSLASQNNIEIRETGFSMDLPKGWSIKSVSDSTFYLEKECSNEKFCQSAIFCVLKDSSDYNLFIEDYVKNLVNKTDSIAIVSTNDIPIKGEALGYSVDFIYKSDGIDLGGTTILISFNNKKIVISFTALNNPKGTYKNHRKIFVSIAETIVLTQVKK